MGWNETIQGMLAKEPPMTDLTSLDLVERLSLDAVIESLSYGSDTTSRDAAYYLTRLRALTTPGEGCEPQRYEFLSTTFMGHATALMSPEPDGKWVAYEDFTREAARANAAISERDENGRAAKRRQDFIDRLRDDKQPMADNSGEITAAEDVLTWLLIEKLTCSDDRSYTPHEAQKIVATALDERDTLKARVAELEAGLHSPDHARNRIRPSPPLRKAPDMSEARGGDPDPVPAPMPHHAGWWTHDAEAAKDVGHLYYFAPVNRAPRPYTTQRHVQAIIDVASDGTLAGVELIDAMPPPPAAPVPFPLPDWGKVKEALKTSRPRINCIIAAIETGNAEAAMIWLRSLSEDHDAALATLEQTDG